MPQIIRGIRHNDRIGSLHFRSSKLGAGAAAFRDMIRRAKALVPKTRDVATGNEILKARMRAAADRQRIASIALNGQRP